MHDRDEDDDRPIGRVLSRRDALTLLGAGGAAALLPLGNLASGGTLPPDHQGTAAPGCVVRPEMTEGPYFVDKQMNRSEIREGRPGDPLLLALTVFDATRGQCRPLQGAVVDIWQCDAKGVYSGVNDEMQGFRTVDQKFLRGNQTTDAGGAARFTTIYPGWYPGRTVHIHFKIRTKSEAAAYEFTSQWYFDDKLNDRILAGAPYARPGRRDTLNTTDTLYRNGGDQLLLAPTAAASGMTASFAVGLDLANADAGTPDGFGARGRGRGPGGPGPGRGRRGGG